MSVNYESKTAQMVNEWLDKKTLNLPPAKLVPLFEEAIGVLQARTEITLSEVTVSAIFDRALFLSQQKYPLLSGMKIDSKKIVWNETVTQLRDHRPAEVTEAFRYLLIELLTIIDNLTAGVLTQSLSRELSKVPMNRSEGGVTEPGGKKISSLKGRRGQEDA
ncbi:MAG: hypothetical protein ACXWPM_08575 [Bdellovibrionota bacterium]